MELVSKTGTRTRAPAAPHMSLEHGALDVVTALRVGAFALLCIIVAVAGAAVVGWSLADRDARGLALVAGALVSLVALLVGGTVLGLAVRAWLAHQARLELWNDAALANYELLSGAVEVEEYTEYSFIAANPLHVAWLAYQVHQRVAVDGGTPYSSRELRGPIIVAGRRVGELSKVQAEAVSRMFAQLGLVEGRVEGYAGRWVPQSTDEALQLVIARWRG